MPDWIVAFVLGIVEGLTEFVPVSSTGHLIVAANILQWDSPIKDTFEVVIQLGAIFAIVLVYRDRFRSLLTLDGWLGGGTNRRDALRLGEDVGFRGLNGWLLLLLSAVPAAIAGFLLQNLIQDHLFSNGTVAIGWIIGGIALVMVERLMPTEPSEPEANAAWATAGPHGEWRPRRERQGANPRRRTLPPPRYQTIDDLTWRTAMLIGLCQCLALWPGVSRSASTIVGGMFLGVSRRVAAEFSFFAAIPVLAGASALDLFKHRSLLTADHLPLFAIGLIVSFVVAIVSVRWFVRFISTHTMVGFGVYRIIAGALLLLWLAFS